MVCAYCQSAQWFSRSRQKLASAKLPSASMHVASGMLHPGIGRDDEDSRTARSRAIPETQRASGPSRPSFFSPNKKQAEEAGLQKKREDAFHGERLADHAAGGAGERRPVGAELKFHGDAGDDAEGEVDAEDARPESRGAIVMLVAGAERISFSE